MNAEELLKCEQLAVRLAIDAGRMMTTASDKQRRGHGKESPIDLVTETDGQVERYLFGELGKSYPDHRFVGEEQTNGFGDGQGLTSAPTWIIDPIDGTTNFVHNNPFTCIAIALAIQREPVLGIVYNPFLDKLYTARKGSGAYCNGRPIRVREPCESLAKALVVGGIGADSDPEKRRQMAANFGRMAFATHGVRCLGSCALEMCYVAEGYADANWAIGVHVWDLAAASLIITEAGGVVVDTEGGAVDIMNRRAIGASHSRLAQEFSRALPYQLQYERDN
ncbi:inositol monophosphatase 1-like [Oppia nitens]|uniref:inositol monophosphatase 1-like n=1 Tax=Oppia nitens TaxID=1686743 RepID=UPI0023D99725|nr:inositol monophosphatase 1-like [Oppia nitens]